MNVSAIYKAESPTDEPKGMLENGSIDCDKYLEKFIRENFLHEVKYHESDSYITEIIEWCADTFGLQQYTEGVNDSDVFEVLNPDAVWEFFDGSIFFKNEQDALLFKLRWVGSPDIP